MLVVETIVEALSAQTSEALHVIDGLLGAAGGLDILFHHTDGGAISDLVFGLCHLIGISFEPRIPQIGKRKMHGFPELRARSTLRPFFGAPINEAHIVEHWDALQRLALSLRAGTVPASHVMRQLAAFPKDGGIAMALREVGRALRTDFILKYLEESDLRRRIHAELNKGESRNALAEAVRFNDGGRFTEQGVDQRQQRAEALTLVTAAIIYWNTVQMHNSLDQMCADDTVVREKDLASLSPVRWGHLNFAGTFVWPHSLTMRNVLLSAERI